jgi:hypothetical protein
MNTVAAVGPGHVGLPRAMAFGNHPRTIGFDIATRKVEVLRRGTDPSCALSAAAQAAMHAMYTDDPNLLGAADVAMKEYGVTLEPWDTLSRADAIVAAVALREYAKLSVEGLSKKLVKGGAHIPARATLDSSGIEGASWRTWRQ